MEREKAISLTIHVNGEFFTYKKNSLPHQRNVKNETKREDNDFVDQMIVVIAKPIPWYTLHSTKSRL